MHKEYYVGQQVITTSNAIYTITGLYYHINRMGLIKINSSGIPEKATSDIDNPYLKPYYSFIEDGGITYA